MSAFDVDDFFVWSLYETPNPALDPFVRIARDTVDVFADWGASVTGNQSTVRLWSKDLPVGGTTFAGSQDENLHSDHPDGPVALLQDNKLVLRLSWASAKPARYIDMTDNPRMMSILDAHRNHAVHGRIFHQSLEQESIRQGGRIVVPDSSAVTMFDAFTPHQPVGLDKAARRVLISAWIEMNLPSDWRARVRDGDVPRLPKASAQFAPTP